ncbi:MAG TPA: NADH-quinone oxidoreductase subunit NuoB [Aggregatilinea sp.]|jgi:Ni,Fe-hydrogenase III small subunit|uniref:NADH-quinone oxidoreductase subunit B family protein n=1 Tax=Aggregatilinea sp. TaxID=2806333 RepID=UPI002CA3BFA8|nr:NADH-quinone oxidoreductase subunit NuoB [Aggregatilinea sp.]HML22459.1 NADH-quinone oxidoreductase subunit NuoB [Aggregatilinea sp.]
MKLLTPLIARSRVKSPWVYCANSGSCNGCDIEIAAALSPRYDAEQTGALRQGSPKHADILIVTGPVTLRAGAAIRDIYDQMPSPKAVVAVGSCPASGGVFSGSPTVEAPLGDIIPVDVYVPGCPPRPQEILRGVIQAAGKLNDKDREREEEQS